MTNEIPGTVKANMPTPAKNSGQVIQLGVAKVPLTNGLALPEGGKVLPQQAKSEPVNIVDLSKADLDKAVSDINNFVQNVKRDLSFKMDEGSGQTVIKVIDSDSGELIRQIPSEDVLAIAAQLREVKDMLDSSNSFPKGFLFSDST